MSEPPRKRLPIRWLSLAELVGVAALVIAGLGYWDAHRERSQQEKERIAAAAEREAQLKAAAVKPAFLIVGAVDGSGGKVRLTSVHPDQVIQTQTLWFPTLIHADSIETTGNPRIEASWLGGLAKAAGKARRGRVPVSVLTVFIEDGQTKTDRAIYKLGYTLHPRLLGGPKIELDGLSLTRRDVTGDLQAAANGYWFTR
jgi:hypothetical protein